MRVWVPEDYYLPTIQSQLIAGYLEKCIGEDKNVTYCPFCKYYNVGSQQYCPYGHGDMQDIRYYITEGI